MAMATPTPASSGDLCGSLSHLLLNLSHPLPATRRRRRGLRRAVPIPRPRLVSCNHSGGGCDADSQGAGGSASSSEKSGPRRVVDDRTVGKKVVGSVDYDKGRHRLSVQVIGVGRDRVPARYRLRAAASEDWTVSEVAQRILRLKHWEDVEGVLNRWAGRFARKNFPLLIREITTAGAIEHSIKVFSWMKNQNVYRARNDVYNMLIRLHARHNRTDQARGLFFEMQEWRCKPDADTYNALINAHGRAGQWRWAMNIMDDMLRAAIPPSRSTYNNVISACGSSGRWKEALEGCKRMTDNGVGPDLVTHNIVLSALKRGSQYLKALSYFELMKRRAIGSYLNTGKDEEALQLYRSMREKKAEPDAATFNILITGSWKLGKYDEALKFLDEMMDLKIPLSKEVYSSVICAYSKQWKLAEAESMFTDMKENCCCPDVVTYTAMIDLYGAAGNYEKAWDVFQEMEMNDIQPDAITYSSLMKPFNRGWQPERVLHLAKLMKEKGVPINSAATFEILSSCSILRDWRSASEFIEKVEPSFGYTSLGLLNQVLHFLW